VIGAGMTRFMRRSEETGVELASMAVEQALDDAGLGIEDIDAVCLGTAPDAFDGVHMKGDWLLSGSGAKNKPYLRDFVGGGTGVFTAAHGWMHVASGKFRTCLVVCEEKMSPCNPHPAGAFITIFDHTTEQALMPTLIHIFGIEMCRFMHIYGYTPEDLARVSVLCKGNALGHPAAQIAMDTTVEEVLAAPVLSWPVKRMDISPTSDGAVALVFCNEDVARARSKAPAFIDGVGFRLDTAYWCSRDLAYPAYVAMAAADAYKMAGVTNPYDDIDFFEPYDPFNYKAMHHMNALLQDRSGRRAKDLLLSGQLERTGSHPMCPSGGLLGVGNPIAAAGLMKIAELYLQLTGQAGARQIQKPIRRGVAQAWGDLMQVGTVVVMSGEGSQPGKATGWTARKTEDLGGTPLGDARDVAHIEFQPDLRYSWDNGVALTTYLDGFKQGKLRGSKCPSCKRIMIPSRSFCELCNLQHVEEYCDLPDTGTVQTFTLSHVDWDSSMLPDGKVRVFAVIAIDGAAPEMGLLHHLGGVKPEDVEIGMRVKAVWKADSERVGTVTDISHFAPLPEGKPSSGEATWVQPLELTSETAGAFAGKIPLGYIYTAGVAGSRFYGDLAKGKVTGTYCSACDAVHLPATIFCESSMAQLDVEADAREIDPASGVVAGHTSVHDDYKGNPLAEPRALVQVKFPGTTGSVFGRLEGGKAELGLRVALVTPGKVTGPESIVFKPAG
jgi:acetyl-CoA C-acetyltransferase